MASGAEKFWSSFYKSLRGLGAAPRVAVRRQRNSLIVQSARRGECSPVGSRGETTSGVSPNHTEDSVKDSYRLEWTVEDAGPYRGLGGAVSSVGEGLAPAVFDERFFSYIMDRRGRRSLLWLGWTPHLRRGGACSSRASVKNCRKRQGFFAGAQNDKKVRLGEEFF